MTGTNVVIATQNPYPMAGNVPGTTSGGTFSATGSGNGAPCLPAGTTTTTSGSTPSEVSSTAVHGHQQRPLTGRKPAGDQSIAVDNTNVGDG